MLESFLITRKVRSGVVTLIRSNRTCSKSEQPWKDSPFSNGHRCMVVGEISWPLLILL
jgi:hypothetical protein